MKTKWYKAYDIFVNSTKIARVYGNRKAIYIAQKEGASLFNGQRHVEVVDTETGEIVYKYITA